MINSGHCSKIMSMDSTEASNMKSESVFLCHLSSDYRLYSVSSDLPYFRVSLRRVETAAISAHHVRSTGDSSVYWRWLPDFYVNAA